MREQGVGRAQKLAELSSSCYKVWFLALRAPVYPLLTLKQVAEKVFVANITVEVIERHIVRGLEHIFSPVTVSELLDTEVLSLAAEPSSAKKVREILTEKSRMLTDGRVILRELMSRLVC